jgi:hypothetical protein
MVHVKCGMVSTRFCGLLCIGDLYVNNSRHERKKLNFGRKTSDRNICNVCLQELRARLQILSVGLWVVVWSLRLSKEHTLMVLENYSYVLGNVFGPEREEVTVRIWRVFRFCAPYQILLG